MFEKEAEEYQIRKHHQRLYGHKPVVMKELNTTFKDGAEFGYNKANEWHDVKDGDLPKIDKPCLVYLANDYVIIAKLREDNVWTTNGHNAFENVIAWKEIVLPELPKESE